MLITFPLFFYFGPYWGGWGELRLSHFPRFLIFYFLSLIMHIGDHLVFGLLVPRRRRDWTLKFSPVRPSVRPVGPVYLSNQAQEFFEILHQYEVP